MAKQTPLRAIKEHCRKCLGVYTAAKLEACPNEDCALYIYRMGTDPNRKKRVLTEEQRKANAARLAASHKKEG